MDGVANEGSRILMSKELIEALEEKMSEQEATIRELQVELMRVTEERDDLQHIVNFMILAAEAEAEAEQEKSFAERVDETVRSVVDMVNQGTADPKVVYPPGRYCGD
jgi:dynactin complex subunit